MAEEEEAPAEEAPEEPPPPPPKKFSQDPLHTEFLYYSAALRVLGPTLTSEADRTVIIPWVRKLFRPEYHSSKLREKRNRYLAFLAISLLLDEAINIFREFPPDGAIPELEELKTDQIPAADWEVDKTWQDTLAGLPDDFQMLECCVHLSPAECKTDHNLDKILDQEFQLFLYMAKPYAHMITNGNDRTRVAAWLQMLCSIHGPQCCASMKAIRNDYMMALLGQLCAKSCEQPYDSIYTGTGNYDIHYHDYYLSPLQQNAIQQNLALDLQNHVLSYVQDLRSVGPFAELPSWKTLKPLAEAAKQSAENQPIIDPTGTEANEFLLEQPMPDDGAFCYIALTGDMIFTNLNTTG